MSPTCGYWTKDPSRGEDAVSTDLHEAEEALYFLVSVNDGDAVRVPVCKRHSEMLEGLAEERRKLLEILSSIRANFNIAKRLADERNQSVGTQWLNVRFLVNKALGEPDAS